MTKLWLLLIIFALLQDKIDILNELLVKFIALFKENNYNFTF